MEIYLVIVLAKFRYIMYVLIMSLENQPLPPLDIDALQFEPLVWRTDTDLLAGTVLKFGHRENNAMYVFECTGIDGGKEAEGHLVCYEDDTVMLETQARVSLLHPIQFLAQQNTPYVEFTTEHDDMRTRITPAFTWADTAFDMDRSTAHFIADAHKREMLPFQDESAQATLTLAAEYLLKEADKLATTSEGDAYQAAARVIIKEFLLK